MGQIHTHYDNLKVARNAPPEIIRAAYKTLSQKHHPDHNPTNPDAMRVFQIINAAYQVLSDPVKRQEHDRWIANEEAGGDRKPSSQEFPTYFSRQSSSVERVRKSSAYGHRRRRSGSSFRHKIQMTLRYFFKSLFGNA